MWSHFTPSTVLLHTLLSYANESLETTKCEGNRQRTCLLHVQSLKIQCLEVSPSNVMLSMVDGHGKIDHRWGDKVRTWMLLYEAQKKPMSKISAVIRFHVSTCSLCLFSHPVRMNWLYMSYTSFYLYWPLNNPTILSHSLLGETHIGVLQAGTPAREPNHSALALPPTICFCLSSLLQHANRTFPMVSSPLLQWTRWALDGFEGHGDLKTLWMLLCNHFGSYSGYVPYCTST